MQKHPLLSSRAAVLLSLLLLALSPARALECKGAYVTGYDNLFTRYGLATQEAVDRKVDAIYEQFKTGDADTQRLFFDGPNGTAYVLAFDSQDIRSEGISYGMMIALQMGDQALFDKFWKFAVTYMLRRDSAGNPHHFAWQLKAADFSVMDPNPAPDGEEYMAMALVFAKARWPSTGDARDPKNYAAWASVLTSILKNNLFDPEQRMVYFSPNTPKKYTDPSYHLPAYYRFFGEWASANAGEKEFWASAVASSMKLLNAAADSKTGLTSEYSWFDGKPVANADSDTQNRYTAVFAYDSWRVIHNMALDYYWCRQEPLLQSLVKRQLSFFKDQGGADKLQYGGVYQKDGTVINAHKNAGLVAMNAVGALAVDEGLGRPFVRDLWNQPTPTGKYRYYDGLLHLFGYLHVSGRFKVYGPSGIGGQLYVDRENNDIRNVLSSLQGRDRSNAELIGGFPVAAWFNGGTPAEVRTQVQALVAAAASKRQVPVLVAYNLPFRDCQQYSTGGATDTAAYKAWIDGFAAGIGDHEAIVIVEPDGLGIIPHFVNLAGQNEWCRPAELPAAGAAEQRFVMLNHAVDRLKARPKARVYLDGTHSNWLGVGDAAWRLTRAGVLRADGFFLNVSNYVPNEPLMTYGQAVSRCIQYGASGTGDPVARFRSCAAGAAMAMPADASASPLRHFIIDTSRNGRGTWTAPAGKYPDAQTWCNPPQRGLGDRPTLVTSHPLLDAKLWIKVPGESDGECSRGGKGPLDPERGMADPAAGKWFKEQAAELIELAVPPITR